MKKTCLLGLYIILPIYIGMITNHYKDPHSTTQEFMESVSGRFSFRFRSSCSGSWIALPAARWFSWVISSGLWILWPALAFLFGCSTWGHFSLVFFFGFWILQGGAGFWIPISNWGEMDIAVFLFFPVGGCEFRLFDHLVDGVLK